MRIRARARDRATIRVGISLILTSRKDSSLRLLRTTFDVQWPEDLVRDSGRGRGMARGRGRGRG